MKTIVLDDDPTGTQSATGVRVLLECSAELIERELRVADSVYVQTNSRAIGVDAAVTLVREVRAAGLAASAALGAPVRFVLRGDSTLRGHVFAETAVFLEGAALEGAAPEGAAPEGAVPEGAVMLFVPAFPDGGRRTVDGIHLVRVDGVDLPAHESEYARDPVFGFGSGRLADYVAEKSGRAAVPVSIDVVRSGGLAAALDVAPAGSVVLPDAHDNADIRLIAAAVEAASRPVVVRCAAPLATMLAGVESTALLPTPLLETPKPTLVVCGSHTAGATAQLARLEERWGSLVVISTALALESPARAAAAAAVTDALRATGLAIVSTERLRAAEHNTLDHGERVMDALTRAVGAALPHVDVVVAKGGITSAEVARHGLGATSATVLGQVLPGVSAWSLVAADGRELLYLVVPGNVGDADTLERVLAAIGLS